MRKILVLTMLLWAAILSVFAQTKNITVSGRLVEDDTKAPAAQATIQLLSLPDSAYVTGAASSENGAFTLPKVRGGKYVMKVSYIGYKTKYVPLQLTASAPNKRLGTLTLESDAIMLAEAVIVAEAPQVQVVEDTVAFNSSAYRTPEGAMLEELVKKLPGAEVDDDGNVKINGKDISKIMVDGKEFFGGDVKTGLKNLPVDMIEKLKTYDKKSDLARITGIDDGEEETVLDLTVKKGMNKGVFGNIDLAGGTKDRYMGRAMVNYFYDKTQVSLIAGANNVNDQGFSGGGGGPRWRRNNGLTATKELGLNFATETEKIELGGSVRYNYRGNDSYSDGYTENFLTGGASSSFNNSRTKTLSGSKDFRADFRMEWKPDTLTNIIFRPNFSWGKTYSTSDAKSGTFNSDPYAVVSNPNDYLDITSLAKMDLSGEEFSDNGVDDPLKDIRVNTSNNLSSSDGNSLSADATLQVNRKLNSMGRNITFRGTVGYDDSESTQYTASNTRYFQQNEDGTVTPEDIIRRYMTTPTNGYNYSLELTYSEPLWKATFLQFRYRFNYSYSKSDKKAYDLGENWNFGEMLPEDYEDGYDQSLSKFAEYRTYTHRFSPSLRFIRQKYQLSIGADLEPQKTSLGYKKGEMDTLAVRNVFNVAPNVDFRYRFSKVSQLRVTYRGRSSQPGMENLLDVTDDSNPLNVTMGNPYLKPSFNHSLRVFYNTYNVDRQQGIFSHVNLQMTQNSISNSRTYNPSTGGWVTKPENINGNWSAFGMFGINSALKNKKFNIGSFSNLSYNNNVGFLTTGTGVDAVQQKNTTTNLTLNERLNGTYRNDWFEFGLNGTFSYSIEKDKLTPSNNQQPYTFSYGASTTVNMPWGMSLSTNLGNQSRRGYSDTSMNRNELIWNAQLSQTFLKGNATLSFEMYDILQQQSNITRSLTASGRSVYQYNGVNSYCMLHFIYRLNIFGGKAGGDRRMGPGFGPGGYRPMGGPGRRF